MNKPPRPLCEVCNRRPRDMDKHRALASHRVLEFIGQMESEGWRRARGCHAVVAQVSKMHLRRGPINYTHDGQLVDGIYIPAWAFHVARRVDARVGWRRDRIREMHNDRALAETFLAHLNLGGIVFDFFPINVRGLVPAAYQDDRTEYFLREDAERRAGTWSPRT